MLLAAEIPYHANPVEGISAATRGRRVYSTLDQSPHSVPVLSGNDGVIQQRGSSMYPVDVRAFLQYGIEDDLAAFRLFQPDGPFHHVGVVLASTSMLAQERSSHY
jgi:hypothetical protein